MNHPTYDQWWSLHLKAARGIQLSDDEVAIYEAGRVQYEHSETVEHNCELAAREAKASRENLLKLSDKHRKLESRRQVLDEEIKSLESQLGAVEKHFIGVED